MRLSPLLWLFILWLNGNKSLQQNDIKCKLQLPALEGTSYEPAFQSRFSPGETVQVSCGEKYFVSEHQYRFIETTCKDDGGWTIEPVCREIICNNPRDPHVMNWGGRWWQQIKLGDTVAYDCKYGYKRTDGVRSATCTRDRWTPKPLCQELVGCESPPPLADGDIRYTIKSNYSHNESVEYLCQTYFTMEGGPHRTCINGEWTGHMRCLKPCVVNEDELRPQNVTLKSTDKKYFSHDEMIEFRCVRGIPVGTVAMQQRCNSGVILLPACN